MKKISIAVMLVALLVTGCAKSQRAIENEIAGINEDIEQTARQLLAGANPEGNIELGEGIYAVEVDQNGNPVKSSKSIYPVYINGELVWIIVAGDETGLVEAHGNIRSIMETEYALLDQQGSLILVSADKLAVVKGDEDDLKKYEKNLDILRRRGLKLHITSLKKKIELRQSEPGTVVDKNGQQYSDHTIIVTFKEGDRQKQIEDYCAFCQGKLRYQVDIINGAVFEFEPKSYSQLQQLLAETMKLDYVLSAELDGISHINSPGVSGTSSES